MLRLPVFTVCLLVVACGQSHAVIAGVLGEGETLPDSAQAVAVNVAVKRNALREVLRTQSQAGGMPSTVRRLNPLERAELRRQVTSQRDQALMVAPAP